MKQLKPLLPQLPPRLGFAPDDQTAVSRARVDASPWRRWYQRAAWRRLRDAVRVRDLYCCKMCGRTDANVVVDHKVPHRGDAKLFHDINNLQCLCRPCHDSVKQREEAAQRSP